MTISDKALPHQKSPDTCARESDRRLGARLFADGSCSFLVWAPRAENVDLHLLSPHEQTAPMARGEHGYFLATVDKIGAGALYKYRLDGAKERPDPASRFQPEGVHGPSQVIGSTFPWTDYSWGGIPLERYVTYELHVGTFTAEGTFDAIIPRIEELKDLGITAIEIMPVAQFPGSRNWGYDGVYPFAVQNSYGGPAALKTLVNECHRREMAVILDVVYNHLGPEGNYSSDFGPYFTDCYHTPWGQAINFERAHSDLVRRFFIENALQWIDEFHMDALRLDAIHAIVDPSARPFIRELGVACKAAAKRLDRQIYVIAESNRNDKRVVSGIEVNGWGLDAEWNDDFHHSLHVLLTPERSGYYQDFSGIANLEKAYSEGFVYTGQYSKYREKHYGDSSREIPASRLVVFAQNHDQVGNRKSGDRLSRSISLEQLKLAAGAVLLSPFLPLLFMGEEYGETAPFEYFVSHTDAELIEAVRHGRKEEFASFEWTGDVSDPQDEKTFLRSKLNWAMRGQGKSLVLLNFYRELLRLRREIPALTNLDKDSMEVTAIEKRKLLFVRRWHAVSQVCMGFHFGNQVERMALPFPAGKWERRLDSAQEIWNGSGSRLPARIEARGGLEIAANPWALFVFEKLK